MQMNKMNQPVIRVSIFIVLFCLVFAYVSEILVPQRELSVDSKDRIDAFYAQPKNSIDVVFIGPSSFLAGINPSTMWEEYGFTSFTRASASLSPLVGYYYLVETLKYQTPQVVILDGVLPYKEFDVDAGKTESYLRIAVEPMRLSTVKLQLIDDIVSKSKEQTFVSYIIPMLRYHGRWNGLTEKDFSLINPNTYGYLKGAYIRFDQHPYEFPDNYMQPTDEATNFDEQSLYYVEKTIKLCKENGIDVIFVTIPRLTWTYSNYLGIKNLAEKYDINQIDYSLPENISEVGLDASVDFNDEKHLSVYGAQKISVHLGAYLQEKYQFVDKRNDPAYEQWNIDLARFKTVLAEKEAEMAETTGVETQEAEDE